MTPSSESMCGVRRCSDRLFRSIPVGCRPRGEYQRSLGACSLTQDRLAGRIRCLRTPLRTSRSDLVTAVGKAAASVPAGEPASHRFHAGCKKSVRQFRRHSPPISRPRQRPASIVARSCTSLVSRPGRSRVVGRADTRKRAPRIPYERYCISGATRQSGAPCVSAVRIASRRPSREATGNYFTI